MYTQYAYNIERNILTVAHIQIKMNGISITNKENLCDAITEKIKVSNLRPTMQQRQQIRNDMLSRNQLKYTHEANKQLYRLNKCVLSLCPHQPLNTPKRTIKKREQRRQNC